jgi:FAD/FMN-containing dehydrogenase
MIPTVRKPSVVEVLRSRVRGEIIQPGDPAYDEARSLYNTIHQRWPAMVLRATDPDDVAAAVSFARDHGLLLAVRGGNHSVAGFGCCDDGLVLDLGAMRRVTVDPRRRVARVDAGCTWADLNEAAQVHGLATTGGLISTTGVAGLTLGGGIGYLTRRHGLACDNLLSAELITADGDRLGCSEGENADLFWALRGGGGNFGVVTSFEFRLHPVGRVLAGPILYPLDGSVLRAWADYVTAAPEALGCIFGLTLAPPAPFVPESWHRKPVAAVVACWVGEEDEGRDLLQALDGWGEIVGRNIATMPYPAVNTFFDDLLPKGLRHCWKSLFAAGMPDQGVAILAKHGARTPTIESGIFLYPLDGACRRVAMSSTAFAHRDATFAVGFHGSWRDPGDDDRNTAWARDAYAEARPLGLGGEYVNFMSDSGPGGAVAGYGPSWSRLVEVKRRYDPHNLFCLNQNIDLTP